MHPILAPWALAALALPPLQGPQKPAPANPGANQPQPQPAPNPAPVNPAPTQTGPKIPPIQDAGDYYILNFDETSGENQLTLEAFVKICQTVTNINFTYAPETGTSLKQLKLKMFGTKRVPKADFYSFFQIMMVINDFVCSRIGPEHISVVLISSTNVAGKGNPKRDARQVMPDEVEQYADQPATLITTVIDLPNTDVRTLSNSLRQMFSDQQTQQIIPVGNSNSLIITGFGSDVASIVKMLKFVDDASRRAAGELPIFETIQLEFASAEEISNTLEELLDASRRAVTGRVQQAGAQGVSAPLQGGNTESKIMVDPRTNSLIVMAMPTDMPRIKELVARLDVDVVERERTYHIYKLENVQSEDLAKTLDSFIKDAQRVTPGGPGGAAGGARGGGAQPAASSSSSSRNEVVVVSDKVSNSLLIAANRTRYDEVLELIQNLDRRQSQVLIETALIELTSTNSLNLGVEIGGANIGSGSGTFGVSDFGFATYTDTNGDGIPDLKVPSVTSGITAGIIDSGDFSMPLLIKALSTRRDTNVLNVPSVLVNNNGSAKVTSKDQQPTTTITATGGVTGQTQENFKEYVDAGITLQISPTISASRFLRLKVSLEVSNFLGAVNGAIPPPKTTRTIDTTVNVPDGATMVVGGIITDNKGKTRDAVPFLGDLPILGVLFRNDSDSLSRTTLYFFVTPHIMRDADFADLAELSYKRKLEAADTIGADRLRVIDPRFGHEGERLELGSFEVPLYKSPAKGEVGKEEVGIDPARMQELLKNAKQPPKPEPESKPKEENPPKNQTPPETPPETPPKDTAAPDGAPKQQG
jgi:general secretion pathway protein D